jgi:hypothetical protein
MARPLSVPIEKLIEMNKNGLNVGDIVKELNRQGKPLGASVIYWHFRHVGYSSIFHYKPPKKQQSRRS